MAIKLKPVDVAVIGLGGAGGVAVLPLAEAGLKIAGIEVGTWLDRTVSAPMKSTTMFAAGRTLSRRPIVKSPLCATASTGLFCPGLLSTP